MPDELDAQKTIDIMRSQGWTLLRELDLPGRRKMRVMEDSNGNEMKVVFRGRDHNKTPGGGYWYGIYVDDFRRADLMVFWATMRSLMLVVPSAFLRDVFDAQIAKIDDRGRWHVNIYFNRGGSSELVPVNYSKTYLLDQFRVMVAR